jgi:DNA mismatch repair protein MutS2
MQKDLINFAKDNSLSPFSKQKTQIKPSENSPFKTRDAKSIYNKTLTKLSENFTFPDTQCLFSFFSFTQDTSEIKSRQDFFKTIEKTDNDFLKSLKQLKQTWKPKYGIVVVTEDETTLTELKKLNCPVQFLNSQYDVEGLENYDIIQVIDCEQFTGFLEQLPQTVFLNSLDEVYLERYLEKLSAWKDNLYLLNKNKTNSEISAIINELFPLLKLIDEKSGKVITRTEVETAIENINSEIENSLKEMSISGLSLFGMMSKGKLPPEIDKIINEIIIKTNLPTEIFHQNIPVTIDEQELERIIKQQNANIHTSIAEEIKKYSKELRQVEGKLKSLEYNLILFDFLSGIGNILEEKQFPEISDELSFKESENLFLNQAQPISFHLTKENRCSILTGANSGGKTTLLEHIIQLITMFQIGLPIKDVKMPIFTDIYYFAKNKGVNGKGAFENLLTQMDKIKPGKKTLILADEIESVTEPGVAGKIISATAEFFINKDCFLIIATHLGGEIQKALPEYARIDGIEAKGLDEYYELIVDHNPVIGKLANSTPELIIEKMANTEKTPYLEFLYNKLKKK